MRKGFTGILEMADELNELKIDEISAFLENKFVDKNVLTDTKVDFKNLSTLNITYDIANVIEKLTSNRIQEITDLSEEDIDAIEYMDDDDPRLIQYEVAKNFALYELIANKLKNNPINQITIDVQMAQKFKQSVFNMALRLSTLTVDEVDALEYADDDDPQIKQWRTALEIAENIIFFNIQEKNYCLDNIPLYPIDTDFVSKTYSVMYHSVINDKIIEMTDISKEDINNIEEDKENALLYNQYDVARKFARFIIVTELIKNSKAKTSLNQKFSHNNNAIDMNTLHNNPNYLFVANRQGIAIYLDLSSVTIHLCAPPIYEISGKYYSIKQNEIQKHFSHESYIRYDEETLTTWSKNNGKWKILDVGGGDMVSFGNKSAANDLFNAAYGRNFYQ